MGTHPVRRDSNMRWRDRAIRRVISGDADKRIVCSLTIRKVFVLTLSFQAKFDSQAWKCRVRNVNQLHIPKLLGVIWSSE